MITEGVLRKYRGEIMLQSWFHQQWHKRSTGRSRWYLTKHHQQLLLTVCALPRLWPERCRIMSFWSREMSMFKKKKKPPLTLELSRNAILSPSKVSLKITKCSDGSTSAHLVFNWVVRFAYAILQHAGMMRYKDVSLSTMESKWTFAGDCIKGFPSFQNHVF